MKHAKPVVSKLTNYSWHILFDQFEHKPVEQTDYDEVLPSETTLDLMIRELVTA